MTVAKHRRRAGRRLVGTAAILACVVFAAAVAANTFSDAEHDLHAAAPGRRVDVGGYRLHLDCRGRGPVTVWFEAGLADFSVHWSKVHDDVAQRHRACAYDRAGLGFSDEAPHDGSLDAATADLDRLLTTAGENGPLLLVGHSYGALIVRALAARRRDVVGLVLLDPAHPEQLERLVGMHEATRSLATLFDVLAWTRRAGVSPWLQRWVPSRGLDGVAAEHHRAVLARGTYFQAASRELRNFSKDLEWAREQLPTHVGRLPVVVISRGRAEPHPRLTGDQALANERVWRSLQADTARISSRGRHLVAERSGHAVAVEAPESVASGIDAAWTLRP